MMTGKIRNLHRVVLFLVVFVLFVMPVFADIIEIQNLNGEVIYTYDTGTREIKKGEDVWVYQSANESFEGALFVQACTIFHEQIIKKGGSMVCELQGTKALPSQGFVASLLSCFGMCGGAENELNFTVNPTNPRCPYRGCIAGMNDFVLTIPCFAIGGTFRWIPGGRGMEFRELEENIFHRENYANDARIMIAGNEIHGRRSWTRADWLRPDALGGNLQPELNRNDFQMHPILRVSHDADLPIIILLFAAQDFMGIRNDIDAINNTCTSRINRLNLFRRTTDAGVSATCDDEVVEEIQEQIDRGERRPGNYRSEIARRAREMTEARNHEYVSEGRNDALIEFFRQNAEQQDQDEQNEQV